MRPFAHENGGDDADQQRDRDHPEARLGNNRREIGAAVVDIEILTDADTVAHHRQHRQHGEIPEHELHQQRNVAHHLDIDIGDLVDDPVLRQPENAENKPDEGRQHNARERDDKRVDDADNQHIQMRRGLAAVTFEKNDADVETGGLAQKAETRCDTAVCQIDRRVMRNIPGKKDNKRDNEKLEKDGPDPRVPEHINTGCRRLNICGHTLLPPQAQL